MTQAEQIALSRYGQPFVDKVKAISNRLGIKYTWLLALMRFESGLNHTIRNPLPGQTATGLIQFVERTAKDLGTTTAALAAMTAIEQLDYVEEYYRRKQKAFGPINNAYDLYAVTFYPLVLQKNGYYVLGSEVSPSRVSAIARNNRVFDLNANGKITKAEFYQAIDQIGMFADVNPYRVASTYRIVSSVTIGAIVAFTLFNYLPKSA